jgi:hypothetical protein
MPTARIHKRRLDSLLGAIVQAAVGVSVFFRPRQAAGAENFGRLSRIPDRQQGANAADRQFHGSGNMK